MTQLFLDAFLANDFSGITGNFAKLALSLLAMGFDLIFMFQHYILYPTREIASESETQPILQTTVSDSNESSGCYSNRTFTDNRAMYG
jgi:hypothetical protein